ncbi:acyl-CoA dehydrogenase family protein [Streptomyces sp. NPDC093225]|uniref:acyl-CoA dehydrogenase family protein n=1 Tax=Streptomyces sp. NPDC093225 TaxID=3366034 RepID=UPI003817D65F
MRFLPTAEQGDFARSLRALLAAADVPAAARAWAAGDHGPGRALWAGLGELGVFALAVPEAHDGVGVLPVELATAFVELGRAGAPGPLVETASAAVLLGEPGPAAGAGKRWLPGVAAGETLLTLAGPGSPYALDADAADAVLAVSETGELVAAVGHGAVRASADPARRLAAPVVAGGERLGAVPASWWRWPALLTAAQALGVGEALLARTVEYVGQRTQFGAPVGSFQAVKHRLADTLVALEFARPLVFGAAVTLAERDVAAAKLAAGEAAYRAARTALQLHGAIGYTEELDLALWLRKARPLRTAWGAPADCRARLLA